MKKIVEERLELGYKIHSNSNPSTPSNTQEGKRLSGIPEDPTPSFPVPQSDNNDLEEAKSTHSSKSPKHNSLRPFVNNLTDCCLEKRSDNPETEKDLFDFDLAIKKIKPEENDQTTAIDSSRTEQVNHSIMVSSGEKSNEAEVPTFGGLKKNSSKKVLIEEPLPVKELITSRPLSPKMSTIKKPQDRETLEKQPVEISKEETNKKDESTRRNEAEKVPSEESNPDTLSLLSQSALNGLFDKHSHSNPLFHHDKRLSSPKSKQEICLNSEDKLSELQSLLKVKDLKKRQDIYDSWLKNPDEFEKRPSK